MSKDLLFEIGTEEMPARYMPGSISSLKELARSKLKAARLPFTSITSIGTPRRLTLLIENLAEKQADSMTEIRGPRADKAYQPDGTPTLAAQGFARSRGIKAEDLVIKEIAGVKYVFATQREIGRPAMEILPGVLKEIINGLSYPRSMRWGYSQTRFARPIRWLVALYGPEVIPLTIENVAASRVTYGHRFLAPGPINLKSPDDYQKELRDAYVIVDPVERQELIWQQIRAAAAVKGGWVTLDEGLLEEINYLVEYPTAFLGEFSSEYLAVPSEVLVTSMKEHQKYFPVYDDQERLLPYFVGVRNGTSDHLEIVKEGNQRVLKARLEDALFFYREDTKEPLENKAQRLKKVIYQERLGTVWAKVGRLQKLSTLIDQELGFNHQKQVKRAALLCKADLETNMVYEFPELQGVMGRHYALLDGEDTLIAEAIFEHYLPRFAGDKIPATPTGIALSLAEKLDNLVGNFAIGVKPTGSQDPFALRRQALGIVAIILNTKLELDLPMAIRKGYQGFNQVKLDLMEDEVVNEVLEFILQRFRGVMQEEGLAYDVLDAVLAEPCGNLVLLQEKARVLTELKQQAYFIDLMIAFNRPNNLARKAISLEVNQQLLKDEAEKQLYSVVRQAAKETRDYLAQADYVAYFKSLANLRPALDGFFDQVMVMVEDEKVRENRLALLNQVVYLFKQFADFSRLVQNNP